MITKTARLGSILVILLVASQSLVYSQGSLQIQSQSRKSEEEALKKAVVNTVIPIGVGYGVTRVFDNKTIRTLGASLSIYGMVLGPSYGNFYSGDFVRGLVGVAARVGAGVMLKDATREVLGDPAADALGWDDKKVSFSETRIWGGTLLMAGSALYNILSARKSARKFNNKLLQLGADIKQLEGTGLSAPVVSARFNF